MPAPQRHSARRAFLHWLLVRNPCFKLFLMKRLIHNIEFFSLLQVLLLRVFQVFRFLGRGIAMPGIPWSLFFPEFSHHKTVLIVLQSVSTWLAFTETRHRVGFTTDACPILLHRSFREDLRSNFHRRREAGCQNRPLPGEC